MVEAKSRYSVNVDTTVFEALDALLVSSDTSALLDFISKQDGQLVSVWSYYSTTNDHQNFTSSTIKLNKLFQKARANEPLQAKAAELLKKILEAHIKIVYRGLSNLRPSITNPILNLLREATHYESISNDFITFFDFNLSVIPKLLAQTNYRQNFLDFWISLLSRANFITKRDLLLNFKKLNNGIYKLLQDDAVPLVTKFIQTLEAQVLEESHFNRATKSKILHDQNLGKLINIFMTTTDEGLKTHLNHFLLKVTTDDKFGLNFPDDRVWCVNTNGTAVRNLKIYNKQIFNAILQMKPFEDDSQLRLLISILEHIPELVAPYTQHMFQVHGANDPKLTSFWIGQTLLLQELVRLPIPSAVSHVVHEEDLSMDIVLENIIPSSLTKACLIKCLQCDSLLIRQLSLQMLLFVFAKLKSLVAVLDHKQFHNFKSKLMNIVSKTKLPDLSVIVASVNAKLVEHKLLLLSYTMVIKEYLSNFPNLSTSLPSDVYPLDGREDYSGVELVILDNYLELQDTATETSSIAAKWWNASPGKNSFFTNLLKLSLNDAMHNKIYKILNKLTDQTIIFDEGALAPQSFAILRSLKLDKLTDADRSAIWKFFDESVSRCVKSPYRYLDRARELVSSTDDSVLSPLVVALFEQWAFVPEKTDALEFWFCLLNRYLILIGESATAIANLFAANGLAQNYLLKFDNYESEFISSDRVDKTHFNSVKEESFFEFVFVAPLSSLDRRIPVSKEDAVGLIKRLELIVADSRITLGRCETALTALLEKLGNFLAASNLEIELRYWTKLFVTGADISNEKLIFVSRILNEIFKQLSETKTDLKFVSEYNVRVMSLIGVTGLETVISEACWCLSDDQVLEEVAQNESTVVRASLLQQAEQRSISIKSCKIDTDCGAEELDAIKDLISKDLLEMDYPELIVRLSQYDDEKLFTLIKSLIERTEFFDVSKIKSKQLLIAVGGVIDPLKYSAVLRTLIDDTIGAFRENFNLEYLQLLTNSTCILDQTFLVETLGHIMENEKVTKNAVNLFSVELLQLFQSVQDYSDPVFAADLLTPWISKCLLYINQTVAESETLSAHFKNFLSKFETFFSKLEMWKFASRILNTQLEIILNSKFVSTDLEVLKYVHSSMALSGANVVESNKLLQIFINNEANALMVSADADFRFYSALVINDLFYKAPTANASTILQANLLLFYRGLKRPEDLILKRILTDIEASTSFNLVNHFSEWEFSEEFEDVAEKFVKKEGNGTLTVTINRSVVNKSIAKFAPRSLSLPDDDLVSFYAKTKTMDLDVYDDEFLLMLIIHNDELFGIVDAGGQDETIKIYLKKLLESNLLQFVVATFASEDATIHDISRRILAAIFARLDSVKQNLYKVYIGNLLSMDHTSCLVILFYASVLPVLAKPNHFLFDKASKFLLSATRLKAEVPLFSEISEPASHDMGTYYRQVSWFLDALNQNLKTSKDFKLLTKAKVIEWMLNLTNSKYLHHSPQNAVLAVLLKLLQLGGANLLCRSYSLVAWLDAVAAKPDSTLAGEQLRLNCAKISVSLKLLVDEDHNADNKRKLQDWLDYDLDSHVKRMCN